MTLLLASLVATSCAGAETPQAVPGAADGTVELGDVEVPSVVGLDLPEALSTLRAVGLNPLTRGVDSDAPAGVVVAQNPEAGSLPEGDPVIVDVSSGVGRPGDEPTENDGAGAVTAGDEVRGEGGAPPEGSPVPKQPGTVPLELIDSGFSWAAWGSDGALAVSAAAVIRNPTAQVGRAFRVTYVVRDDAGMARGSATEWVRYAAPNSTMHIAYRLYLDPGTPPSSLEVAIEEPAASPLQAPPGGTFSALRHAQENMFGQWTNPTDEQIDNWLLACVGYAGGRVVGGGWTTTDLVPPGSSTAFRLGNGQVPGITFDEIRWSSWDNRTR